MPGEAATEKQAGGNEAHARQATAQAAAADVTATSAAASKQADAEGQEEEGQEEEEEEDAADAEDGGGSDVDMREEGDDEDDEDVEEGEEGGEHAHKDGWFGMGALREMGEAARSAVATLGIKGKDEPGGSSAPAPFKSLGSTLSSWWNAIDPVGDVERSESRVQGGAQGGGERSKELENAALVQKMFGLPEEENLIESFPCKLVQSYRCCHNAYTPEIQMSFRGVLYITDQHVCYQVEEQGRKLPVRGCVPC
eukprot:jgi/Mesvir1/8150/Mv12462-RA.3